MARDALFVPHPRRPRGGLLRDGALVKLRDLQPHFLRYVVEPQTWSWRQPDGTNHVVTGPRETFHQQDLAARADGLRFLCPVCFQANGGAVGTHGVICWFVGRVPDTADPKPGRWNPEGVGYDDLSFVGPGNMSVQLTGGCNAHFFIRRGQIES